VPTPLENKRLFLAKKGLTDLKFIAKNIYKRLKIEAVHQINLLHVP
jgi:hypothetical protein